MEESGDKKKVSGGGGGYSGQGAALAKALRHELAGHIWGPHGGREGSWHKSLSLFNRDQGQILRRPPLSPGPRGCTSEGPAPAPLPGTAVCRPKRTHPAQSKNLPQNTFWVLRPLGSIGQRNPHSGPLGAPSLVCPPPVALSMTTNYRTHLPTSGDIQFPSFLNTGLHNSLPTHRELWHCHHMTSKARSPKGTGLLPDPRSLSETLGMGAPS